MRVFRLSLLVAGVLVAFALVGVIVVFNSSFQTWAARKAMASQTGVRTTIGSVSAGTKRVELKDLRFERDGAVLTVPFVEIEMPLWTAGWSKKVFLSRLVAKGWTLDLTKISASKVPAPTSQAQATNPLVNTAMTAASAAPANVIPVVFGGIFTHLEVPVDLTVDGVQLEGDVILPDAGGRAKVILSGGGLGAGREGKFDLAANTTLTDPKVSAVELRGGVIAAMDTPRSFTRIVAQIDAAARGTQFPNGVKLRADVVAARAATGETYSVGVVGEGRELVNVRAAWPRNASKLDGSWKLDVRHADIVPFALGLPLPEFAASGNGTFDTDAGFERIHLTGTLTSAVNQLHVVMPELARLGELQITAAFDLADHNGTLAVQTFEAAVRGPQAIAAGAQDEAKPIVAVRTLQAFEFNYHKGELRTADATRELVGIALQAVPLPWAAPFVKQFSLDAGRLRGELVATARGAGATVRSTSPLIAEGVTISQAGKQLVHDVAVSLNASADYTAQGWQAEINQLTMKGGEHTLFSLDGKAGQLAGDNQALKATGKLAANLPALLTQPIAEGSLLLTSGEGAVDFAISSNATTEVQATIAFKNLETVVDAHAVKLPAITTTLRADRATDGKIAFNAPIILERDDRKSDLTVIGTLAPEKEKVRMIDAEVTSTQLIIDDAQVLAALVPSHPTEKPAKSSDVPRESRPPWSGLSGSLALHLNKVVYSDAFQVSNVTGRLRLDAGMLKLEGLQAGLGEGARANVTGAVTFDASAPQPYTLAADVAVVEFDPAPLLRALSGNQPPTVEGRFDMTSKLASRALTLSDLATGAGGDFQITSKGGTFRGLPVNVGNVSDTTSKLAAWIASAGTAIGAVTGRKEFTDVANKAEAVAELARNLNPLRYDQLSVLVSRDAALNTRLNNFTLISPEVRLTGNGTALHKAGASILDDSLAMEFTLRARGRQGELLKYLGALEPQIDDLGYATCTVPLKVGGTLGKPDTSELNSKLAALALEKSGFGDKAAELLSKIRGK